MHVLGTGVALDPRPAGGRRAIADIVDGDAVPDRVAEITGGSVVAGVVGAEQSAGALGLGHTGVTLDAVGADGRIAPADVVGLAAFAGGVAEVTGGAVLTRLVGAEQRVGAVRLLGTPAALDSVTAGGRVTSALVVDLLAVRTEVAEIAGGAVLADRIGAEQAASAFVVAAAQRALEARHTDRGIALAQVLRAGAVDRAVAEVAAGAVLADLVGAEQRRGALRGGQAGVALDAVGAGRRFACADVVGLVAFGGRIAVVAGGALLAGPVGAEQLAGALLVDRAGVVLGAVAAGPGFTVADVVDLGAVPCVVAEVARGAVLAGPVGAEQAGWALRGRRAGVTFHPVAADGGLAQADVVVLATVGRLVAEVARGAVLTRGVGAVQRARALGVAQAGVTLGPVTADRGAAVADVVDVHALLGRAAEVARGAVLAARVGAVERVTALFVGCALVALATLAADGRRTVAEIDDREAVVGHVAEVPSVADLAPPVGAVHVSGAVQVVVAGRGIDGADQAKAAERGRALGQGLASVGAPTGRRLGVDASATGDPRGARGEADGVEHALTGVGAGPVPYPLRHVAGHVVDPPRVGIELPHRDHAPGGVSAVPADVPQGVIARARVEHRDAAVVERRTGLGAVRILPLGLGGQAVPGTAVGVAVRGRHRGAHAGHPEAGGVGRAVRQCVALRQAGSSRARVGVGQRLPPVDLVHGQLRVTPGRGEGPHQALPFEVGDLGGLHVDGTSEGDLVELLVALGAGLADGSLTAALREPVGRAHAEGAGWHVGEPGGRADLVGAVVAGALLWVGTARGQGPVGHAGAAEAAKPAALAVGVLAAQVVLAAILADARRGADRHGIGALIGSPAGITLHPIATHPGRAQADVVYLGAVGRAVAEIGGGAILAGGVGAIQCPGALVVVIAVVALLAIDAKPGAPEARRFHAVAVVGCVAEVARRSVLASPVGAIEPVGALVVLDTGVVLDSGPTRAR